MSNQHVGESSAITGTAVAMKSTALCSSAVKLYIVAVVSVQIFHGRYNYLWLAYCDQCWVTQQVGQTHVKDCIKSWQYLQNGSVMMHTLWIFVFYCTVTMSVTYCNVIMRLLVNHSSVRLSFKPFLTDFVTEDAVNLSRRCGWKDV